MAAKPLSPAQIKVLRHAKRGWVYRSNHGYDLYASRDIGNGSKDVSRSVYNLTSRRPPLLQIGPPRDGDSLCRTWLVTEAGEAELAKYPEED